MQIIQDNATGNIALSQTQYIDGLLKRFGLHDVNPVSTPLHPNVDLDSIIACAPSNYTQTHGSSLCAGAIGSNLFAVIGTRPDATDAVRRLAQFTKDSQPKHAKLVFRYLMTMEKTVTHKLYSFVKREEEVVRGQQ